MIPVYTSQSGDSMPSLSNMQAMLLDKINSASEKVVIQCMRFSKAVITPLPLICEAMDSGVSKEHSEQECVKKEVYLQGALWIAG